jgi:DNA-binding PadR family transcriptional regulator
MRAARWQGGDAGLDDLAGHVSELLGGVGRALFGTAGRGCGPRSGARTRGGSSWERQFGGRRGPGHWGGGFGGPWGPFGPWSRMPPPGPARRPKAGRGDVRAAILALLREGPRTGYQIMSEIEERSAGAWRPSPGAVYPALAQLADEGLILGEESAGRRSFSLTEAGQEYVEQNPEMARGAWESAAQQEAWQLPGLFAQAARLGHGIVQVAQAGTPEQIRAAEQIIERARRSLYQLLAEDSDGEQDDNEQE